MKTYGWKFVVLIICAALVFIWLVRAPIAGSYLTGKMRVPVSIGWIGLWPSSMNMHSFKIKNPPGFDGPAFKAREILCSYQLSQLFGNPAVVDQILIRNAVLHIDFTNQSGTENNWTAIGRGMSPIQSAKEVLIHKLILTNFTVEIHGLSAVGLLMNVPKTKHFDRLEFDNIDSRKGFPTEQLVRSIFQGAGIDQYLQEFFNPLNPVNELLNLPKIGL